MISISGVKNSGGIFSSTKLFVSLNYNSKIEKTKVSKWAKVMKVKENKKFDYKQKSNLLKVRVMDKGLISNDEIGHANYDMSSVVDSGDCKTETLTMQNKKNKDSGARVEIEVC